MAANNEPAQIDKHVLAMRKKEKSREYSVRCCVCYTPFIYHFKLSYFDGFSAVRPPVLMQR